MSPMVEHTRPTAFIDVNVVTMEGADLLPDHVVLVEGTRIASIVPAQDARIPPDATVIDGEDGYLMPGLADMHVHLAFRDPDPNHLVLYLAQGVTTVRSMSGLPANADWRRAVEDGQLVGPTILTAGNVIVDGLEGVDPDMIAAAPVFIPRSAEEAVEEVRRQAEGWPDFVKVYEGLQEEHYLQAIAAANEAGVYVAGHVLDHLDRYSIFTSGIDEIAHLDELNHCHWLGSPDEPDFRFDFDAIEETARSMVENDVAVVFNLVADEVMHQLIFDADDVWSRPEYRVVRPQVLERWMIDGRHTSRFVDQGPYRRDQEMPFFKELVRIIHRAGVVVTVGSDTSPDLEGSIPSNIHRDLELLVESGLLPFEALGAGTRAAGAIVGRMGRDGAFGTIAPGQRADLLLLADNPLVDVSRTRDRVGVMARGRWHTQGQLDAMVEAYVATYSRPDWRGRAGERVSAIG